MSFTRRSFLAGTASGLSVLVLAACTDQPPTPTPTPRPTSGTEGAPAPQAFFRSNWASDPFARGATTYTSVGALPQGRVTLQEPVLDRVFLAGEALSDEPGTVRGAISSGRAAAQRALAVIGDGERVAVIGAGAAGAAAASVLAERGTDVIVVEARDRTGGRIDSNAVGDDYFELGAWRLTELDDAGLIDTLAQEGVEFVALEGGSSYAPEAGDAPADVVAADPGATAAADALGAAAGWAQQQAADVSVADAVREGANPDEWPAAGTPGITGEVLLEQLLLTVAGMTGADADAVSAWFSTPTPAVSLVPLGPLSAFIDAALDSVDTVLSTTVAGISYGGNGVSLRLGTGESLSVDRVIVTAPVGVLQEQVIEFDPALPVSHRGALGELTVGNIELVRLEYDTAFWSTEAVWWVREDEDDAIRMWINLLPATGRPVLLGVVAGERALEVAEMSDGDLEAAARRSLAPFAEAT